MMQTNELNLDNKYHKSSQNLYSIVLMENSCAKSFHRFDLESLIRQFITILKVLGKSLWKDITTTKDYKRELWIVNIM